jgi:hypothetical protein
MMITRTSRPPECRVVEGAIVANATGKENATQDGNGKGKGIGMWKWKAMEEQKGKPIEELKGKGNCKGKGKL